MDNVSTSTPKRFKPTTYLSCMCATRPYGFDHTKQTDDKFHIELTNHLKVQSSRNRKEMEKYCDLCICYICDTKAKDCPMWNVNKGAHCLALVIGHISFWDKVKYSRKRVHDYDYFNKFFLSEEGEMLLKERYSKMIMDDFEAALRAPFVDENINGDTNFPLSNYGGLVENCARRLIWDGKHRTVVTRCQEARVHLDLWKVLHLEEIFRNDRNFCENEHFKASLTYALTLDWDEKDEIAKAVNLARKMDDISHYVSALEHLIEKESKVETSKKNSWSSSKINVDHTQLVGYCKTLTALCYVSDYSIATNEYASRMTAIFETATANITPLKPNLLSIWDSDVEKDRGEEDDSSDSDSDSESDESDIEGVEILRERAERKYNKEKQKKRAEEDKEFLASDDE